jgi:hypothetical protein
MTVLLALHRGRPAVRNITRRRVLRCAGVLLAGTVISTMPGRISFAADADAQWARLQRGLSQKSMAGCRKAADRLMPRLGVLLKGPQWEAQTYKAIVDELKQAGVYPDRPAPLSPECAESLRGEAGSASTPGSIDAGLGAAADNTAFVILPGTGPIIGAILLLIAAVIVMIGQIIAKALEDQAAAKEKDQAAQREKEDQATKIKKMKKRTTDEMARRDDCILFGKKPD